GPTNTAFIDQAKAPSRSFSCLRSWVPASAGMTPLLVALALLAACSGKSGDAYQRGLAAFNAGDVRTARVEFLNAIEADPGDLAGALEAADRAVAARPSNVEALVLHGTLTRSQYGLAAAIPWFDQALSVDHGNVEALLARAATLGDLGRMSEMLADARAVHRLTGGHRTAYYLEAVLAARARNFQLAKSLWARTGGEFDTIPAGRLLLSAIDFETGNEE